MNLRSSNEARRASILLVVCCIESTVSVGTGFSGVHQELNNFAAFSGSAKSISTPVRCLLLALSGHPDPLNQCPLSGVKRTSARHCAIAEDCSAIYPACVNFVFLQCGVVAHRLAAWVEVARDYRRFVVSRLAPEESQVSRYEHQRHSYF
jgi:hypothetical protein